MEQTIMQTIHSNVLGNLLPCLIHYSVLHKVARLSQIAPPTFGISVFTSPGLYTKTYFQNFTVDDFKIVLDNHPVILKAMGQIIL